MNIDYGFFHLLTALRSMQNGNRFAQTQEWASAVEPKLPDIDHSLLSRTILHQDRPPTRANRCCEIAAADLARETIKKRIFASDRRRLGEAAIEEETTVERRDRIKLLTAALATQVVLGATYRSLNDQTKQTVDRTVNP